MINNCLFFAISLWWKRGGYLVVRKSRLSWVPHFMWTASLENIALVEFTPDKEATVPKFRHRHNRWFPVKAILFKGYVRVKRGDDAEPD